VGEWLCREYEVPPILPEEDSEDADPTESEVDDEPEVLFVDDDGAPVIAVEMTAPLVSGQHRVSEMMAETRARREVVEIHSMVPAPYNERTVVTPDIARTMLERYTPIARPPHRGRVVHYVGLLTRTASDPGAPLLDEIAVSASGHTVAGQALLLAIVETGISIETLVRRNHPGPAQLYADGADPAYMARAVEALNDRNSVDGTRWCLTETTLSSIAHEDGKLRRIELWHMTDAAARAAGLLD
jgi:hypothetical protein